MGNFYGIEGVKFIGHGEWSDPEVEYAGARFNYYDLESPLFEEYSEKCKEEGKDPDADFASGFSDYLAENTDKVYEQLDYLKENAMEGDPLVLKEPYFQHVYENEDLDRELVKCFSPYAVSQLVVEESLIEYSMFRKATAVEIEQYGVIKDITELRKEPGL